MVKFRDAEDVDDVEDFAVNRCIHMYTFEASENDLRAREKELRKEISEQRQKGYQNAQDILDRAERDSQRLYQTRKEEIDKQFSQFQEKEKQASAELQCLSACVLFRFSLTFLSLSIHLPPVALWQSREK